MGPEDGRVGPMDGRVCSFKLVLFARAFFCGPILRRLFQRFTAPPGNLSFLYLLYLLITR